MRKVLLYFFLILGLALLAFRVFQNQIRGPWEVELTDDSITKAAYLKVSSASDTFSITKIDEDYLLSVGDLSFPVPQDSFMALTNTLANLKSAARIKRSRMNAKGSEKISFTYKNQDGQEENFALLLYESALFYESALSGDLFKIQTESKIIDLERYKAERLLPKALNLAHQIEDYSYLLVNTDSLMEKAFLIDSTLLSIFAMGLSQKANTSALTNQIYRASMQLYSADSLLLKTIEVFNDTINRVYYLEQQSPYRAGFRLDSLSSAGLGRLIQL